MMHVDDLLRKFDGYSLTNPEMEHVHPMYMIFPLKCMFIYQLRYGWLVVSLSLYPTSASFIHILCIFCIFAPVAAVHAC